ncbi:MAG: hypothetical protein JWM16_933 [Verrucomicrobiales bacterium]|nr:hypothetical protein [Verrucomicrobiales bacterium]
MLQILKRIPGVSRVNSACKSRLQEHRAYRNLHYCRELAKKRGIQAPHGAALQQALKERLVSRSWNRGWPKRKGDLHIFLAYYVSNWESVLPKSLAPFGKVTAFNWAEHGFCEREQGWLRERDRMNALMLESFYHANREQPVDAVVGYLSGNTVAPEILLGMSGAGAATFNFCFDDKLHWPGRMAGGRFTSPAAIAHAVDLNLTNAPESVIKYAAHGGLALFWPEAACSDVHKPHDIPFEFDVSFVGSCYGWRPQFIHKLKSHGIRVECFGKGWPNGPLSDEEMVKLYSRSRINLGFGGIGYSWNLRCLKGRDFEVPMSGGLYLTQYNPELDLISAVGKEIVTYTSAVDCAEKINSLLADPHRAKMIRDAGRIRALRSHTYQTRWEEAFSVAGLI